MDNSLSFKKKAIFFFLLAIIIMILALFFHSYNHLFHSTEKITNDIQKKIQAKEIELDKTILKAKTLFLEADSQSRFKFLHENLFPFDHENFFIYIYDNNKLKFWSDNTVQLDPYLLNNKLAQNSLEISNGIYDVRLIEEDNITVVGLLKIKTTYPYENEHLTSQFANYLSLSPEIDISFVKDDNPILDSSGDYLFSADYSNYTGTSQLLHIILTFLFLFSYILLISSIYYAYKLLSLSFKYSWLMFAGFVIDVLLIRFLLLYFSFPSFVYETSVFQPELYASSNLASSLGDLCLNLITLFAIGYVFFHLFTLRQIVHRNSKKAQLLLGFFALLLVFISYIFLINGLVNTVIHSSISFNLANITSISFHSIIGFICFALYVFIFYLFSFKPLFFVLESSKHRLYLMGIPLILITLAFLLSNSTIGFNHWYWLFFVFYIVVVFYIVRNRHKGIRFASTVLLILLFSLLSTYSLNQSVSQKENAKRIHLAQELINQRDPIIEYDFSQAAQHILADTQLVSKVAGFPYDDNIQNNSVIDFIYSEFFSSFKANSEIWLTLCDSSASIDISADGTSENCHAYFAMALQEFGMPTDYQNLHYIDNVRQEDNYLGIIEFPFADKDLKLYVEIFNIYATNKIGYPELLVDKKEQSGITLSDYSYCMYEEGVQINQYGNFFYALNLSQYNVQSDAKVAFFQQDGYDHVLYTPDNQNAIIVSTKKQGLIDIIAPFSYLSIFFGLLTFIFFVLFRGPGPFSLNLLGFRKRLQLSVTAIIIISFLFVGIGSMIYIIGINQNKNISVLQEKSRSVLIELKHKLESQDSLNRDMENYLEVFLLKFSQVFFTDINLYDLDGQLLATSRKAVFRKALVSEMIDPAAFLNMHSLEKSLFIHEEKIGEYTYLSAYMPLRNDESKLIAYLNLPYFAKQDELTNEISAFLVAFINVYVILIAFSIYLALVISNYITKPIELIRERIGKLKLGKSEEKIEWHRKDEIGSLVAEYNRMVDELAQSAELLAKSERESAWREMAKQIAHEIKNPLTPMKLSVQYLQKAWNEQAPDWDDRLQRFSNTIIEQINSLSIIATEFSDFAKMPRSRFEKVDLTSIIQNAIGIFKQSSQVKFDFEATSSCMIYADREQILRVFNNLIKNSIQAIPIPSKGIIQIIVTSDATMHYIKFSDNGKGIPGEMQEKVFYPNFTTKSGGMGLGLAMVKNIIENAKGNISFESTESVGTMFYIELPKASQELEEDA